MQCTDERPCCLRDRGFCTALTKTYDHDGECPFCKAKKTDFGRPAGKYAKDVNIEPEKGTEEKKTVVHKPNRPNNRIGKFIVVTQPNGAPCILRFDRIKELNRKNIRESVILYDNGMEFTVDSRTQEYGEFHVRWKEKNAEVQTDGC